MTNDKLVKNQAIERAIDTSIRRKAIPVLPVGHGSIIQGSIFDCNRKSFERRLRDYSDRLYVGWNPFKNEGRGCWEVWHRPSRKTLVFQGKIDGVPFYTGEYKPNDYEHWVADLDYLSYSFITKLVEMDAWENRNLVRDHEDKYEAQNERAQKAEDDNIRYVVKHNKSLFKDLLEYTQQGYNPLDFFTPKK